MGVHRQAGTSIASVSVFVGLLVIVPNGSSGGTSTIRERLDVAVDHFIELFELMDMKGIKDVVVLFSIGF